MILRMLIVKIYLKEISQAKFWERAYEIDVNHKYEKYAYILSSLLVSIYQCFSLIEKHYPSKHA